MTTAVAAPKVVVTRHAALVEFLLELGLIDESTPVIPHGGIEDVRGKHVIGPLPLWMAAEAAAITNVQLAIPAEKRGVELTLDEVRQYYRGHATYIVRKVS